MIDTQIILSVSAQSFTHDWNRSVKCPVDLGTAPGKVQLVYHVLACSQHPPLTSLHSPLFTVHPGAPPSPATGRLHRGGTGLFQTSSAPALPGRSFASESTNLHSLSGTRTLFRWHGFLPNEHRCTGWTGLTGLDAVAGEAGAGDDPARVCGCPGLHDTGEREEIVQKNPVYPVHPCRQKNLKNMDRQDAQDNQDGRVLHERVTPGMNACGFADVQDYKPAVSRKNPVNPVHPVHRCESIICPRSTFSQ